MPITLQVGFVFRREIAVLPLGREFVHPCLISLVELELQNEVRRVCGQAPPIRHDEPTENRRLAVRRNG